MATNPLLAEINGLSPGAKTALLNAHNASGAPTQQPANNAAIPEQPQVRLHAPSMAAPPPMIGAPPASPAAPTSGGAPPSLGAPSLVPHGTLQNEEAERQRLLDTGSGIHQIRNPALRTLAGVGNAIGSIVAPGIMREIPGTEEHHNLLLNRNLSNLDTGLGINKAQAANEEAQARAYSLEHPPDEFNQPVATPGGYIETNRKSGAAQPVMVNGEQAQPAEKQAAEAHVIVKGPNGEPMYATDRNGQFYDQNNKLIPNAEPYEKPEKPPTEAPHPVLINGKPGFGIVVPGKGWVDPATQQPIQGTVTPIPPPPSFAAIYPGITGQKGIESATNEWQKNAGEYQTALANLQNAKNGSELAASLAPLGVALVQVRSGGIARLNMNEINAAGPALGSIARRVDAALQKAGAGAIPPETLQEMGQLVRSYQAIKYKQYLAQAKRDADAFNIPPNQRFVTSMDGQQDLPMNDAMKQAAEPANAGAGEMIRARDPKGKLHEAPAGTPLPPGWVWEKTK